MKRRDKANLRRMKALERMENIKRKIKVYRYESQETQLRKFVEMSKLTITMNNTKMGIV